MLIIDAMNVTEARKVARKAFNRMTPLGLAKLANEELCLPDSECWRDLGEPLPKAVLIRNILAEIEKYR